MRLRELGQAAAPAACGGGGGGGGEEEEVEERRGGGRGEEEEEERRRGGGVSGGGRGEEEEKERRGGGAHWPTFSRKGETLLLLLLSDIPQGGVILWSTPSVSLSVQPVTVKITLN